MPIKRFAIQAIRFTTVYSDFVSVASSGQGIRIALDYECYRTLRYSNVPNELIVTTYQKNLCSPYAKHNGKPTVQQATICHRR